MNNNKSKNSRWELMEGEGYESSDKSRRILSRLGKNKPGKITMGALYAMITLFGAGITREVFGEGFAEKLVATTDEGNIIPITNVEGKGTTVFPAVTDSDEWFNESVFSSDKLVCTKALKSDYTKGAVAELDNKSLQEIDSVPASQPTKLIVDLETGMKAFAQWDSVEKENQIRLVLADNTEQILTPNSKYIHALEFSNTKLYAAIQDKTDSKYYIKVFAQNGDKQYTEDTGNKIELPGPFKPDNLEIHNGKIVVTTNGKVYIYNQNTNQLEYEDALGIGSYVFFGARPGTNEVFMSVYLPRKVVSLDLTTHQIKALDTNENIVGSDYGITTKGVFSNDGNRLYIATTNDQQIENHLVTVILNKDGTYTKTVSVLSQTNPINLAMDVDPDGDKITNGFPDNCPEVANNAQLDKNNNGKGDACENPSDYAASVGYDSYQEPTGTGHNVFSNGNVDIVDMGDKVVVSPVQGEKSEIEIINNGNEQTKGISVNIPPNTDYEWVSLEGFGDDEKTEGIDFPEGQIVNGSTEENGIVAAISGTDIKLKCTPKIVQPEQTESQADEFTGADEISIPDDTATPDELTPDTAEITPDVIDAQDTYEVTPDIAEITLDTSDTIQSDQFDAYDPGQSDTGADVIQSDQNQPDTNQPDAIQSESEKPKGGGGGCDMNNGASEGAKTLTLAGAALLALAAMRKKIRNVMRG